MVAFGGGVDGGGGDELVPVAGIGLWGSSLWWWW